MEPARETWPHASEDALERMRREFVALPGLQLTPAQASRIWSLDVSASRQLLDRLVASRFLVRIPSGAYVRADRVPASVLGLPTPAQVPVRVA